MEGPPPFFQQPQRHPQQRQPQRQHPQQQQQQPSPPTALPPPRPARYQRAPQCLLGATQMPLPGAVVGGSGGNGGQQHMQQPQYMPQHQQQQQQQMQQGPVAWQPWGQEGGAERGGPILPASSLRACYEGKTPIDALHRVASKLSLKVEFFEGELTSPSDPASLAVPPGQRQKGEMISILAYVDGRPCSYGTAATRGAAKHIASLEALRLLLVPPVHPMPFDESLLIFPARSGLDDPPPLPPSFPPPRVQAPGPQFKPLPSPPSLPPRTPTYPQKIPSFHSPSAHPSCSSSLFFVRQGERPQNLMIIEEEGMERERTQGGGWHGQQQQHQQQYQQQQRLHRQQWQQRRQLQQQQQRLLARPPSLLLSSSFQPPAQQLRFQGGGGAGAGAGAGGRGRQRVPTPLSSYSATTLPSGPPPPSQQQGRAGGGTMGGRGSSSGCTGVLPTPPPSPSMRVPAVPLTPAAVLLENEGKEEEGMPIQWPVGTKAPMLGETFTGGTAEATALLNKLLLVFKSPSTNVKHTEITAPAPSASSFHRPGSPGSVLGYVCTVEVRLEGPSLQVATTIRTKAQARTKKESLQLASRAVLAKLFPQATSLRQVEEALAQYQDTKKERERGIAYLNKKAKKLSRQQGINESTQMDVEGRKEALSRTGEEEKEEKGEAMEEGDGDKEGHTTKKARTSSPSPPPSSPSSSSAAPLSASSALLAPFVNPQPAACAPRPALSLPPPPPLTLAISPAPTTMENKPKPTWRSPEQLKGVASPFLALPAIPLPSSSSFASSLAAVTTKTSAPVTTIDTNSKDAEEAPAGGSSSGGGLFDGVVAHLRGVAGAIGATGDVGAVRLLHSLCQAQCSDFPQYEIIEQAPKGGDEENMEEGTEGEVKESPLSSPIFLGPNTRQAFLGKARFGDSSTGQLIEVSAQGSSKTEVQRLLAVAMLEELFPGQTFDQVQDHVKRVEETRRAERAAKAQDKFVQLEKKKRLQRALGEPTNALQFQQQEAQARGDQARSLHFIALPAFEVVDTNFKSETKAKTQHLLLQALHDELEEAAKGNEGGQAEMNDEEDEEKYWANVAAEEKSLILAKQPTALSASRRLLALSPHARRMDAKGLRIATLDDEREIMRALKASQEKLTKTVAEEGSFWEQLREEYLVPGAPHTILLLSFPTSLPSSSFTSLCFLHSTVQRRHTTAVGRKEAEAKKRKERDEKFAQSQGKAQAKGEDGDGMIGPKMLRLQGHYVDPAAWDASGDTGLVPRLRGFYRTLFRAARRCGVERCEFWTQRVNDPVVEALEEMDNRRIVGPENNQVLYSAGRTQMRATLAVPEEEGEGGGEGEGMEL